jgi:hypothetical protein
VLAAVGGDNGCHAIGSPLPITGSRGDKPAVSDAGRWDYCALVSDTGTLASNPTSTQAVRMTDSTALPEWTDHNVSDPGITLVQAIAYTIGAVVLAAAATVVLRRRRRAGSTRGT